MSQFDVLPPHGYRELIEKVCTEVGTVPPDVLEAMVWVESNFDPGATSPFQYLKDNTSRLIADVKAMLKRYQEGTVAGPIVTPTPTPIPVPAPVWSPPKPVMELALLNPDDAPFFTTVNGVEFEAIFDEVTPLRVVLQKQYAIDGPASDTNKVIGPDLKPGERVTANYRFKNSKGTEYLYLSNHARVEAGSRDNPNFKRVAD